MEETDLTVAVVTVLYSDVEDRGGPGEYILTTDFVLRYDGETSLWTLLLTHRPNYPALEQRKEVGRERGFEVGGGVS